MARTNLLNTRTTTLLELIGNGRIYRVPPYQRDYSWEEEQWEDLWNDVLELRQGTEVRHYMGALVVEAKSDREFLIIDGQQRMATLSLLALAVIDLLRRLADEGVDSVPNGERAVGLRSRFIGEKDPASLVESSKLFLNETDDAFYQDYLVQLRPPLNPRGLPRSNRLLWDCFRYFSKKLGELDATRDGARVAEILSETVARQLLFILITVEDELNAYTVFETLNARGLELTTTDLLKNYLFSRVPTPADLAALGRRWKALLSIVRAERFPDFLRHHLLCEESRIRAQRLFKIVRDRVQTPEQVFGLIEALEARAELYAALSDPHHGYWVERPEARRHVRELALFRSRQMTPLLFAAWEKLTPEAFVSVLRLVATISFRYSIVGNLNTNALEPVYHQAAKAVLDGHATASAQVFERLRPIYVPDDKFETDFQSLVVESSGQQKKLARYILARLESDASGRDCDPDTDPATIEHILPENPGAEWETSIARETWDSLVYRLGNLTLLEASTNRTVGNRSYSEKRDAYSKSGYQVTRAVPVDCPDEWTIEQIGARQKRLAKRATHIWRVDA